MVLPMDFQSFELEDHNDAALLWDYDSTFWVNLQLENWIEEKRDFLGKTSSYFG